MTRMLCSLLVLVFLSMPLTGCSLFESEEGVAVDEIDRESFSDVGELEEGGLLDTEDEMLAESADLVEGSDSSIPSADEFGGDDLGGDDFAGDDFGGGDEFGGDEFSEGDFQATTSESNLDNEFEAAELGDGFGDDSFSEDEFADFSQTDEAQIDQELAGNELEDFSDAGFEEGDFSDGALAAEDDPFAFDGAPVVDEPAPAAPVIDVPETSMVVAEENTETTLDPARNQVTNLEYKAFEKGGTVVIETQSPALYEKIVDNDLNQVIIEVQDVFLPERFKRPYITKDFKQDIATINAYSNADGSARFVIQMKRPINPSVQQEGGAILVMTSDATPMETAASEESLDNLVSENQMGMSVQTNEQLTTPEGGADEALGGLNAKSGLSLGQGKFVGDKISLEFGDTDVRTIINTIADKSGVNLIMDKDVEGTTSLRLRNVPWDQALLVLLRSQGLGYVKRGNVLRIAKQSTLSQEAQSVSNQIQNEKKAKLLSGGIKVKYIPVSYANVSELSGKLAEFTSEDGKIAFDNRTSSLVITDYGEYIERILELVKALDTPPMQVEIESKLVEAREEFSREAGINWDLSGQSFPINSQSGQFNSALTGNLPNTGFSLDLDVGTFDIFGDLEASLNIFESQNKIKVLSQPRVVTMNKVEAVIEQTTQVPIRQLTINPGSQPTVTFNFVDLVLSLKVTPQITFKGDVILDVEMKREFAGVENDDGSRELAKRRAKTTVMVKNGKTAVIGGIYQVDDTDSDGGIPWLKDIPLIGYLFKQITVTKNKNELLLFLKPKILKEVDGPMVSKTGAPGSTFDPFEELSVDEGSSGNSVEAASTTNADSLEGFEDSFDDGFEDDFGDDPTAGSGEGQFDEEPLDNDFDSLTL